MMPSTLKDATRPLAEAQALLRPGRMRAPRVQAEAVGASRDEQQSAPMQVGTCASPVLADAL
eukprot:8928135-Alexandrium_andersonii.AAC.1